MRIEQGNECKEVNVIYARRSSLSVFRNKTTKKAVKLNVKCKSHCEEHKIWSPLDRFISLANPLCEIHNNTIH